MKKLSFLILFGMGVFLTNAQSTEREAFNDFEKDEPLSLSAIAEAKELIVYPNPVAAGTLNIKLNAQEVQKIKKFQVFNISGQLVAEFLNEGVVNPKFDVSQLAAGNYILVIEDDPAFNDPFIPDTPHPRKAWFSTM